MSSAPERRPVTIRRAPKIIPFLVLGALLGLICAGIIAFTGPESSQFSRGTVLGFFSALLLIPGLLLGAIVALVFDWLSVRRSRKAIAESTGPGTTREPVDEEDAAANRGPIDEEDGGAIHGPIDEEDGGAIHGPGEPEGRADTNGDDADRNR